jgi:epoxyqueuosine reductase
LADGRSAAELSRLVRQAGQEAGFDRVGIAAAVSPPGFHPLIEWLNQGYHADMQWISRRRDAYQHPDGVMPRVRSVIIVAMNYHNGGAQQPGSARVSRYAWGTSDYHSIIRERLKSVAGVLHRQVPGVKSRAIVDTAPLLERDFARLSGMGWFGKNTMLINRQIGSWFFLGALLTDAELEYDQPYEADYCGTCVRCLDACPTDAFPEAHVLDANRCISYLTIERRDKSVPLELRAGMGDWMFGCDVCQEVCPWNRFAPPASDPLFEMLEEWRKLDPVSLLQLTEEEFDQRFRETPLHRTGRGAILRNAAIVIGNQGSQATADAVGQLEASVNDDSPLVRGAAAWALAELRAVGSVSVLRKRMACEPDAEVLGEIERAVEVLEG